MSNAVILHNPDGAPVSEEMKVNPDYDDLDDLNEEEKVSYFVLLVPTVEN